MNNKEIAQLENQLRYHNRLYYELDAPEISDLEYDKLWNELKKADPNSAVLNERGQATFGVKIPHKVVMGSLNKAHTAPEVIDYFSKYDSEIVATPKIDGASLSLHYKNGRLVSAVTRGDTLVGEDVTANASVMDSIPLTISDLGNPEVRGEAYISKTDFYGVLDQDRGDEKAMKNPRNAASGSLRQQDPNITKDRKVRFVAYILLNSECKTYSQQLSKLSDMGFETPDLVKLEDMSEESISKTIEKFAEINPTLPYETDGIVFRLNDDVLFQKLGLASEKYPKGGLAYKFNSEKAQSKILSIEWTTGRTGRVAPVALIEPTDLNGSTIGRITLNNPEWINRKGGLSEGDTILFEKSGEIIPQLLEVLKRSGKGKLETPKMCPSCGVKLEKSETARGEGVHVICPNTYGCPAQVIGSILHMLVKLDVRGVAEATVEKILENGLIKNPWEIFDLNEIDLTNHGLFGVRQAEIIVGALKNIEVTPEVFLSTLGIPMWGRRMFVLLFKNSDLTFEDIIENKNITKERLIGIPGIQEAKAESLCSALLENDRIVSMMYELSKRIKINKENKTVKNTGISGKSFLITGTLSKGRKEIEADIVAAGGEMKGSVSKNLDYLVVGEDSGSKLAKAQKLGVATLSEEELYKMIGG